MPGTDGFKNASVAPLNRFNYGMHAATGFLDGNRYFLLSGAGQYGMRCCKGVAGVAGGGDVIFHTVSIA